MKGSEGPRLARYVGYTKDTENHGDEALVWIIRDLLAPEIEVTCEPGACDIALLGGGTLINQSAWLIDFFGKTLDAAGSGCVFGTGVGDQAFWGDHFDRWVPLLDRCDFVGVRGPDSERALREHGVGSVSVVGDPYLALAPPVERRPVPKRLGVNLGVTNDSLWGTTDRDLFEFAAEVLRSLREAGWRFIWVSVWSRDLPEIRGLRETFGPDAGPVYDARFQGLETLSAVAGCDLFLGEKLHANAMAAVAGVPFVSLEYQPKVRDFAASVGMDPWLVSTAERDPAALIGRIESLHRQRDAIAGRLRGERDAIRARLVDYARRVREFHSAPSGGGAGGRGR